MAVCVLNTCSRG